MRTAILGFGLIGGSIARALRRGSDRPSIAAWSPSGEGPRAALADGVIDAAATSVDEAVADAELVIIAGPPLATLELIDTLAGMAGQGLAADATVTDVASTKGQILARADATDLRFVGGHPMAGRHTTGYEASEEALFEDRPWVVVRGRSATDVDVARVEELARATGARPIRLGAAEHDDATAAISHVPLLTSVALVEAIAGGGDGAEGADWATASALAATGWRDATRLARGDPEMGAGVFATNADAIGRRLRDVRAAIDDWLALLDKVGSTDPAAIEAIEARLRAAKDRLDRS